MSSNDGVCSQQDDEKKTKKRQSPVEEPPTVPSPSEAMLNTFLRQPFVEEISRNENRKDEHHVKRRCTDGLERSRVTGAYRSPRRVHPGKLMKKARSSIEDLRTAFGLLDRDSDGHVTPAELQFMLRNLGIEVRDDLIADLIKDASKSG
ncbi:Calcium-binding protein E63-1 [Eumeta japonica]|uniref:Calcium-binding protein E63-1 n=1 Tax=Eumeta variegata TaxID=151549 RepID=A0A4C1UBB8_EUMVA|nr:Calcium-binding protein E63-1 [Eumeta japonica]